MKSYHFMFIMLLGIIFTAAGFVFAAIPDANNVREIHPQATVGCTVCHPEGDFKSLNSYGQAYKEAGRNLDAVKQIEEIDTDGDGINNGVEIEAGTSPGVAEVE